MNHPDSHYRDHSGLAALNRHLARRQLLVAAMVAAAMLVALLIGGILWN